MTRSNLNAPATAAAEKSLPQNRHFFLFRNEGFGEAKAEDDYLHPLANAAVADDSVTETQFFAIECAEHAIHGQGYLWHHPRLGVVSGGIWLWQGFKSHVLACEMYNYNTYMHDRSLDNDLHRYRLENGYGVEVLEPLRRHRLTYTDQSRKNSVDIEYSAIAAPIMWGDGKHFEQTMHGRGVLQLQGREYDLDFYTVRDRSWGKPRPEHLLNLAPVGWMTCVFGEDFYFNCNGLDDPELMPEWKGLFSEPKWKELNSGWIVRNGEVRLITHCRKRTERDPRTLFPKRIELELVDSRGDEYRINGKATACSDREYVPTARFVNCQLRWEWEGREATGEEQEAQWSDFVAAFMR